MTIYIDTNTFSASPMLYADAEKTKALPRIIPAVQLTEGNLQIGFLGDNTPLEGSTLSLSAVLPSRTQILASDGDFIDGASVPTWEFSVALNSAELAETLESRGSVTLSFGVIATATGYRQEWQFLSVCTPTATGELDPEQVESAKDYAEQARQAADDAEQSKQAAATSASNAATSATNAATSARNAASSASAANASAGNAATSATNAANSASAASTSANNAAGSATAAAGSAGQAAQSAEQAAETLENVYTKPEIDGVDTGAEVTLKMNEIIAQLKDWEEVTGETLPNEFWEALMAEFQRWQENPTETKEWETTSATESTNPYFSEAPTKPVVDFTVTKSVGVANAEPCFSRATNQTIYLPFTKIGTSLCLEADAVPHIIAPSCTNLYSAFRSAKSYKSEVYYFPALESGYAAFSSSFSGVVIAPRASGLSNAFNYSKMSAANIAKTLNSLPSWSSGTHTVGFMGASGRAYTATTETFTVMDDDGVEYSLDNCPLFTLDDEEQTLRKAYVLAIAKKGWEVVI